MEIVVKGRNSEISDRFREHVIEKLQRIDKYDQRKQIHRVEVEITHERNPRQHNRAARVEMTLRSRAGIVETGLFLGMAESVMIATSGGVRVRDRSAL